ncbi:phosphate ABC transporter substrate-binding protein [Sphingomonas gilva]|uniref:Phosphate ABC transporter substrate-binding protein n=1 Tax=Sphingomonas gilva TaxID=2305907 RepID=A0A396RM36_9SPHN|nr:substrate-binding domain-containing protein [Sphingomonas gilva]RHW17440.1 phosphate ABC transporter substrate-binding protein [Sphingomonas gilva]
MTRTLTLLAASTLALAACSDAGGEVREQIRAVGSSTVYPFTTAVAEQFTTKNADFRSPIIESTGTGAGMQLFCAGVGAQYPDLTNASRRMKKSEFDSCQANGVKQIVELQVGIDGLALVEANNGPAMSLTTADVYKALAANPGGKPQTARTWRDVNPSLPAVPIQVYGPPSTSGTRDSLVELIMVPGCDADPAMKALKETNEDQHEQICSKIREDGAYIESGENDNLIVQKLASNPTALGVLGYSFLEENQNSIRGVSMNGVAPTYQTISDFSYPGARAMFIYVKGAHVNAIPGLKQFVAEYAGAWNPDGYLTRRGLIASPDAVRKEMAQRAAALTPMTGDELK